MSKFDTPIKRSQYISCGYYLNGCRYKVTEAGYIWERNYRTRQLQRFKLRDSDIVRVTKIANMHNFGHHERAEMLRDIFYEDVEQTLLDRQTQSEAKQVQKVVSAKQQRHNKSKEIGETV